MKKNFLFVMPPLFRPHCWPCAISWSVSAVVTYISVCIISHVCASTNVEKTNAKGLIEILAKNNFTVVRRVSDLPVKVLTGAKIIPAQRKIESIMVDPGRDYQDRHAGVDFQKPTTQLVFAALSRRYLLLCYWVGGVTKAEHIAIVELDVNPPKLVANGVVYPQARSLSEFGMRIKQGGYVPFDNQDTYIVPPFKF